MFLDTQSELLEIKMRKELELIPGHAVIGTLHSFGDQESINDPYSELHNL